MKASCSFSLEEDIRKKLPELRKKSDDLNLDIENFLLKLMRKHGIDIKAR